MNSLFQCTKCGSNLSSADKFCGSCGSPVEVSSKSQVQPANVSASGSQKCRLCGSDNPVDAGTCKSCGNVISSETPPPKQQTVKDSQQASIPLNFFQSWKLTVAMGILLVAVVIFFGSTKEDEHAHTAAPMSQNASAMIKEIETLQHAVDNNPQDADAMLRLANLLHDVRAFPRAIDMYNRYLQLNPGNPDARVDLGIMFFQMAMLDSVKFDEYISIAKTEMEKALTYAPKHQLAHFNLGIVTLQGGDLKASQEWFAKCIAVDSTTESARRAKQLMHQHSFTNP